MLTDSALAVAIAVGAALVFHLLLFALLSRFARLSHLDSDQVVVDRLRHPLRWSFVAIGISLAAEIDPALSRGWLAIDRFLVPALRAHHGALGRRTRLCLRGLSPALLVSRSEDADRIQEIAVVRRLTVASESYLRRALRAISNPTAAGISAVDENSPSPIL